MSGFDEEAERERLREKYERDREERTATQRMSELLLKGATMTNKHCDACGDPIFRHDGQEFCPTCQAGEGAEPTAAQSEGGSPGTDRADAGSDATAVDTGGEPEPPTEAGDDHGRQVESPADRPPRPETDPNSGADRARAGPAGTERVRADAEDDGAGRPGGDRRPTGRSGDRRPAATRDGLAEARASLTRTLVEYSRAAEGANDPRRATELLDAAREAAEALAALDRR